MLTHSLRFLALPSLIQAPRDYDRALRGLPSRSVFNVEDEVILAPHVANSPIGAQLLYPAEYRRELSDAYSEVYLLRDDAAVTSLMEHRPLRELRDPARVHRARLTCNGQNPVQHHLNPVLVQLGLPLI
jgi:hypothetical protein